MQFYTCTGHKNLPYANGSSIVVHITFYHHTQSNSSLTNEDAELILIMRLQVYNYNSIIIILQTKFTYSILRSQGGICSDINYQRMYHCVGNERMPQQNMVNGTKPYSIIMFEYPMAWDLLENP